MLDRFNLIHTRVLHLLMTTIETKILPKWAVMLHVELIKTIEKTEKSRISCPHVLTRILAHAHSDRTLEPCEDLDEGAPNIGG